MLGNNVQLAGLIVILSSYIGKAVDAADDVSSVLPQAIENDAQGRLAHLVGSARNANGALGCSKGLMSCKESKALGFFAQKHRPKVAMAMPYIALVGD